MAKLNITDEEKGIQQTYIDAAILHGKATLIGDYKTANKQYKVLARIYKLWANNPNLAKTILESIFFNENPSVKIWAATHSLQLNILIKEAKEILQHCSVDSNIGIFRLDAEMVLKEWNKKENA